MTDKSKTAKTNKTTKTIKNKKREVTEMENEKQNEIKNVDIALQKGTWFKETAELMSEPETDKKEVRWSSSNPQVAAVNEENGHIYGKGIGEAEITATAADGTTEQFAVSVTGTPVLVSAIKITYPGGKLIRWGESFWCKAKVFPTNATNKTLNWDSGDYTGIFVDSTGQAAHLGTKVGPTSIGVHATDGSGVSARREVTAVHFNPIHSITLGPEQITLTIGQTFVPTATVCTENATYPCVRWSTSDPSVVTVNSESGLIMGQSVGTATVTATAIDGSDVQASCTVEIIPGLDYCDDTILPESSVDLIKQHMDFYTRAADKYDIPWQLLTAVHFMEYSLSRNCSKSSGPYGNLSVNNYQTGYLSDSEFQRATDDCASLLRGFIDTYAGEFSGDSLIKRALFCYNGATANYIAQGESLGFTHQESRAGEGSPYVMNRADLRRDPTVEPTKSNNTWGTTRKRTDGTVYFQYPAVGPYGTYVVYKSLKN